MRNLVVSVLLCMPLLVACGTTEPAFGQPGASVVKDVFAPAGVYTFNFRRDDVYLPDLARLDAVNRYLNLHPRSLPPACLYGITLLDVVDGEDGKSAATFECLKPNRQESQAAPEMRGQPKGQAGLPKMLPPQPLSVPF